MVDYDNNNQHTFSDDDSGSLLEEALANGEHVQICRKKKDSRQRVNSIMGFFGGEEEEEEEEVVTAQPSSIFTMRRVARANLEKAQSNIINGTNKHKRRHRQVKRCNTYGADSTDMALRRRNNFGTTPKSSRSISPGPRPIGRSITNSPRRPRLSSSEEQQLQSQQSSPRPSDTSVKDTAAYTNHEETIKRLTIQDEDIQKILQDPQAFSKLQKVLRKHGAVTNEVLKQVLPLYVKHQLNISDKKTDDGEQEEELTPATSSSTGVPVSTAEGFF